MRQLRLFVFGPPRLERDGEVLELGLRRGLALLVYLAVTGQAHSRDSLATLLWPEHDQRDARANLRRTLHRIGQAVGDDIIAAVGETISITPDATLWVDSLSFATLSSAADTLEQAAQLYRDDFLAGFSLPDSPVFDEWQFFERERLRQLLAQNLEALARRAKAGGAWDVAAEYARRWVAMDPLHEPAQRVLLEAYAQAGQAAAAVRQYQELARALEAELGAEPEEATTALYEAIRTRRLQATGLAESPPESVVWLPASPAPAPAPAAAPIVGRERELEELLAFVARPDGPRLVTVIGPGGVGKTRLAQAVVEQAAGRFAQGAHFVTLAEVGEAAGIAPAIAARLGLVSSGSAESALLHTLHDQALLLVLDNFEHLIDAAPLVAAILDAAPRARILVTSRERLDLGLEQVYPLHGLAVPGELHGAQALEAPAAQLFLLRARMVRPALETAEVDHTAIARICRLVQGMPLALNLAASWAELLSFAEIADEIARSLDFLASDQHDLPERQRSVRAVFDTSWRRLPPALQQTLSRLTVFRGGFTRQAAEQVAGADLHALRRLLSSSFITLDSRAQRYAIHELLRQFLAEQVRDSSTLAAVEERHCGYYLHLLRQLRSDLHGQRLPASIAAIAEEFDNIQAAWQLAAAQSRGELLAGAAEGLWFFCDRRGQMLVAQQLFAGAAATSTDTALQGLLLAGEGFFTARCDPRVDAWPTMEQGLALLRQAGPAQAHRLAFANVHIGLMARSQWRFEQAERLAEESLALFADADDQWGATFSLLVMGLVYSYRGRPVLAGQLLQTSHDRAREIGERGLASMAATTLATDLLAQGDYVRAREHLDEALSDANAVGDPLNIAFVLHERAMLAAACGDIADAVWAFESSSRSFARTGAPYTVGLAEPTRAVAAALRGDLASAELVERLALAAANGSVEQAAVVRYLELAAELARGRGSTARAEQLLHAALRLARRIDHEPHSAAIACRLANLLAARSGEQAEVRRLIVPALEHALRHQLAPVVLEAAVAAARAGLLASPAQAVELLTAARDHPAASHACREQARLLLAPLGAQPGSLTAGGRPGDWRGLAGQLLRSLGEPAVLAPPTNVEPLQSALIGRDYELARLAGLLSGADAAVITLLGPGGIGKSRLAHEAGLVALDSFPDGVFFVPLAPLAEPDGIAPAILEQLGLPASASSAPREQLVGYLRDRKLLLILDNFEHLRGGAELLSALRAATPRVRLLVTSRERLGLDGEVVVALRGIEIPAGEADELVLERGAIRLLLERVRALRPGFDPTPADIDAMIRIARLVQGMPLALILAASWADLLTLEEIAVEIGRSLDVLEADLQVLPPRQRSVRAVFEASWGRLPPAAQDAFARLSVFRGGFSRRAALRVAGADLRTLRALLDSSFIALDGDDRYGVHELLRQFGAEQLEALGQSAELMDRHSDHYLEELAGRLPDLKGAQQLAAYAAIEQDLDNMRQAWEWAVQRRDGHAIGLALDSLFEFCEKRGRFHDGTELLTQARARLAPTPETGPLWPRLTIRLSLLRSRFPRERQVPLPELERGLALVRDIGMAADEALGNLALAAYYARTENDYRRSLAAAERAHELHLVLNDRYYLAETLARLSICYGYLGDTQHFYERCSEGCAIAEADGNLVGLAIALTNLSEALLHLGRYDEMLTQSQRLAEIARSLGLRVVVIAALAYNALGRLLRGELSEARRLAVEGYRLSGEINSALSAGLHLSVLNIQAGLSGDYVLGKRYAEESLGLPLNLVATVETYWGLAIARCGMGQYDDAEHALRAALTAASQFATLVPCVWLLPVLALLLKQRGRPYDAAATFAVASTHPLRATGWLQTWTPLADLQADLEHELGPEPFAAAWSHGLQLTVERAVALLDGPSLTRAI